MGGVLLSQPFSYKLLSAAIILAVCIIAAILVNGEYSRRENVRGYITTREGTIKVYPSISGTLLELHVGEGQQVKQGDLVAQIHTARKNSQGLDLSEVLIGELLKKKALIEARIEQDNQVYILANEEIKEAIEAYQTEKLIAEKRLSNLENRQAVSENSLGKLRDLREKGFLSEQQFLTAKEHHLQLKADIQAVKQGIVGLGSSHARAQSKLEQLPIKTGRVLTEHQRHLLDLNQDIIELKSRRSYSIRSTIDGRVTSIQSKTGQMVNANSPLLVIIPDEAEYQAELFVPSRAIGFIQTEKVVLIRYDAFPYQQFGVHPGRIVDIAESIFLPGELIVPVTLQEPVYRVRVALDSQFINAFSKKLALQSGMLLDADIILEKRSFVEWLLEPLYSLRGKV